MLVRFPLKKLILSSVVIGLTQFLVFLSRYCFFGEELWTLLALIGVAFSFALVMRFIDSFKEYREKQKRLKLCAVEAPRSTAVETVFVLLLYLFSALSFAACADLLYLLPHFHFEGGQQMVWNYLQQLVIYLYLVALLAVWLIDTKNLPWVLGGPKNTQMPRTGIFMAILGAVVVLVCLIYTASVESTLLSLLSLVLMGILVTVQLVAALFSLVGRRRA